MRRMRRLTPRRVITGAFVAAIAVAAPMMGGSASAASGPSPALVAAEAAPAVQLVVISYDATVLVPNQKNNLPAQQARQAQLHTMAANGQIGSSLEALNDQWAKDLASDPNRYAYPGRPVHAIRTSVTATCSGWFVTPTGYLVTAAHCVTKDSTITDDLATNVLPRYIDRSYKGSIARWKRQSIPMDQTIHSQLRTFETKGTSRIRASPTSRSRPWWPSASGARTVSAASARCPRRSCPTERPTPGRTSHC